MVHMKRQVLSFHSHRRYIVMDVRRGRRRMGSSDSSDDDSAAFRRRSQPKASGQRASGDDSLAAVMERALKDIHDAVSAQVAAAATENELEQPTTVEFLDEAALVAMSQEAFEGKLMTLRQECDAEVVAVQEQVNRKRAVAEAQNHAWRLFCATSPPFETMPAEAIATHVNELGDARHEIESLTQAIRDTQRASEKRKLQHQREEEHLVREINLMRQRMESGRGSQPV